MSTHLLSVGGRKDKNKSIVIGNIGNIDVVIIKFY